MKILTAAAWVILSAASHGVKDSPKVVVTECRFMAVDPETKDVHIGKWEDCETAENTEEYIFETLDHEGLVVFTEEHTQKGKKWTDPKLHSKPRVIHEHEPYTEDWSNS